MTHRQQSNLIAAVVLAVSVFFFICGFSIRIDRLYPQILCAALAVFSVATIIQTQLEARAEAKQPQRELDEAAMTTEELAERLAKESEERTRWQDVVAVILIAFLSLILWKPLSFLFASFLGIFALSLYKRQPIIRSLLVAFFTALVIQLIFRNIFTIPIPSPSWWPYF